MRIIRDKRTVEAPKIYKPGMEKEILSDFCIILRDYKHTTFTGKNQGLGVKVVHKLLNEHNWIISRTIVKELMMKFDPMYRKRIEKKRKMGMSPSQLMLPTLTYVEEVKEEEEEEESMVDLDKLFHEGKAMQESESHRPSSMEIVVYNEECINQTSSMEMEAKFRFMDRMNGESKGSKDFFGRCDLNNTRYMCEEHGLGLPKPYCFRCMPNKRWDNEFRCWKFGVLKENTQYESKLQMKKTSLLRDEKSICFETLIIHNIIERDHIFYLDNNTDDDSTREFFMVTGNGDILDPNHWGCYSDPDERANEVQVKGPVLFRKFCNWRDFVAMMDPRPGRAAKSRVDHNSVRFIFSFDPNTDDLYGISYSTLQHICYRSQKPLDKNNQVDKSILYFLKNRNCFTRHTWVKHGWMQPHVQKMNI